MATLVANVVTKLGVSSLQSPSISHHVICAGSWLVLAHCDVLSSISVSYSNIFKKYLGKFQEIHSKKILIKIFENIENNFFEKFREVFRKLF